MHDQLHFPVTVEEVKNTLFSIHSYKAPESYGFQPTLFKTSWHIVGNNVWKMVLDAFTSGSITLAHTLFVPIMKIDIPHSFKDFHLIS